MVVAAAAFGVKHMDSFWPTIVSRVIENSEPLRKMARDYYVSYESMQRVIRAARRRESGPFSNG